MSNGLTKRINVGIEDFKTMIEQGSCYIDKSLFIKDLLSHGYSISLITRPRRFGKTLNMSMLKYFFDMSTNNSHLFKGLDISNYPDCLEYQAKYPVISLSLKDIKHGTWEEVYNDLCLMMQMQYSNHEYLLNSEVLGVEEKLYINRILTSQANSSDYTHSLGRLSHFLYKHYNHKIIILIDEYDSPIQSGFANTFYNKIIDFMRSWLTFALKGNSCIEFAVLTGVLRIAKESIFSGLNNIEVYSILDDTFSEYFGFTEHEIQDLFMDFECVKDYPIIKQWYGGYCFGSLEIYNPYSVMSYLYRNKQLKPYWINTADNSTIRQMLERSTKSVKRDMVSLLNSKSVDAFIDINTVYNTIYNSEIAIYGFLLFTGYLTAHSVDDGRVDNSSYHYYTLSIPNEEVMEAYRNEIFSYLETDCDFTELRAIIRALIDSDLVLFTNLIQDLILKDMSFIDSSESFYHGLMLGLLSSLSSIYEVKSNRESGYGRFDIMLIPKSINRQGIIMEFKYSVSNNDMSQDAQIALKQIDDKHYDIELIQRGVLNICKYGIAFHGKQVYMLSSTT